TAEREPLIFFWSHLGAVRRNRPQRRRVHQGGAVIPVVAVAAQAVEARVAALVIQARLQHTRAIHAVVLDDQVVFERFVAGPRRRDEHLRQHLVVVVATRGQEPGGQEGRDQQKASRNQTG